MNTNETSIRDLEQETERQRREAAVEDLHAEIDRCGFQGEAAIEEMLEQISRRVLRVATLKRQNSDALDFHDLPVWKLKEAMRLAYHAGQVCRSR